MKVALFSAAGIGDGLLMMILAHHLKKALYHVVFFHKHPSALAELFPSAYFAPYPPLEDYERILKDFDLVILENDHSERAWKLFTLRDQKQLPPLVVLFVKPYPKKTYPNDITFDPHLTVAENLQLVCQQIFLLPFATKDNGLLPPLGSIKHLYKERIILHPTSGDKKKNWKRYQFLALAKRLESLGYTPTFCLTPDEKKKWDPKKECPYPTLATYSLVEMSRLIYESGYFIGNDSALGHLASNLGIPTLTISNHKKNIERWRPGWSLGNIVAPPCCLPNFKGIPGGRIRENYWHYFTSVNKVLKAFEKLCEVYPLYEASHES